MRHLKAVGCALGWALWGFIVNYRAIIESHSGRKILAARLWLRINLLTNRSI